MSDQSSSRSAAAEPRCAAPVILESAWAAHTSAALMCSRSSLLNMQVIGNHQPPQRVPLSIGMRRGGTWLALFCIYTIAADTGREPASSLLLLAPTLVRSNEQRSRRRRKDRVIERRFDTERNRHGGTKHNQQHCACEGDPHTPDPQDQSNSEKEFRYGGGPREKWDGGRRHEGVYFRGITYKACKISIANVSPTVKSEAVGNAGKERRTERNARVQSCPPQPVRATAVAAVLTGLHVSPHSCGVVEHSPSSRQLEAR